MPSEYAKTLGARLRAIRTQQGLSLHGVEEKSRGRWKAVVVGSYERGDRSVTVQKLAELAEFYEVTVSELLPGDAAPTPIATAPKLVIDLERMNQLPKEKIGPLARYVATIQAQRGDYNGRVLSIRQEDLRSLAVIYDAEDRPEPEGVVEDHVVERARGVFTAYRAALAELRADPYSGALPRDPTYLSWTLAACAPLPMPERQALLEADDTTERLLLVTDLLQTELRAMNVIPSLPATDVARTRWSPN